MKTPLASVILLALLLSLVAAEDDTDGLVADGKNRDGFKCGDRTLWVGDDGEEVCIPLGEGICRDSGELWGVWRFGVREEDGVVLLDPNRDAVYMDFPGATHICIGEETLRGNPNRQPYLYIVDECNDEFLAELFCEGIDADHLSRLKMTDLDDTEHNVYDFYPLNVVKFRKGPTKDRQDDNSLWKIEVEINDEEKLEGQVVVNEEYCVWEEYYSSSRCSALDCASVECCDVYSDDLSFVFPQCDGSDYCNAINETSVFETVVVDFEGICLDMLDSVGDKTGIIELTPDEKARLERALLEFSQDEETCSDIDAQEGCLNRRLGDELRQRSLQSSEGIFEVDTSGGTVTLIEYEQIDPCVESNDGNTRRLRRQKSKGRYNKSKKGNNRRRRRNRRRLVERQSDSLVHRRSEELECPPELVLYFQDQGFENTFAAEVTETIEKDCEDVTGDACTGEDGDFTCCGYKPECACGNFTSESSCAVFGCGISSICCSFDICLESGFCVDQMLCKDVVCAQDNDACTVAECDPSNGECVTKDLDDGETCIDSVLADSIIPNPSFENFTSCPDGFSQLNRAVTWIQATDGTSDFWVNMPSCDDSFIKGGNSQLEIPQHAPDGDGFVGAIMQDANYIEYIGACLFEPLYAGTDYTLQMQVAAASNQAGYSFGGDTRAGIALICIPDCNLLPLSGRDDKTDDYEVIATALVDLIGGDPYQTVALKATPTMDCPAVIFGPTVDSTIQPGFDGIYILFDDLTLNESSMLEGVCQSGVCVP